MAIEAFDADSHFIVRHRGYGVPTKPIHGRLKSNCE